MPGFLSLLPQGRPVRRPGWDVHRLLLRLKGPARAPVPAGPVRCCCAVAVSSPAKTHSRYLCPVHFYYCPILSYLFTVILSALVRNASRSSCMPCTLTELGATRSPPPETPPCDQPLTTQRRPGRGISQPHSTRWGPTAASFPAPNRCQPLPASLPTGPGDRPDYT